MRRVFWVHQPLLVSGTPRWSCPRTGSIGSSIWVLNGRKLYPKSMHRTPNFLVDRHLVVHRKLVLTLGFSTSVPYFSSLARIPIKMLSRIFIRRMATGNQGVVPTNARYQHIQEMQNHMLRDDGLLVWQKNGTKDKLLYFTTVGMCVFGFIPMLSVVGGMSFPKKAD